MVVRSPPAAPLLRTRLEAFARRPAVGSTEEDRLSEERRGLFAAEAEETPGLEWRLESSAPGDATVPTSPLRPQQFLGFGRLIASLEGVRGGDTIALIAPTGFGKTSLLTQWSRETGRPHFIVPLPAETEAANDLLGELLAILNPAAFKRRPREEAAATLDPAGLEVLTDPRALLAIDDVHNATHATTVKLLVSLINHLPGHRVLAIAGRRSPAIRQRDLQSPHRVTQLNQRELGLRRSDLDTLEDDGWPSSVLDRVLRYSGGWPAGVRQVIEWYADFGQVGVEPRSWCLSEYYRQEVLEGVPAELLTFLREVAVIGAADSAALDSARNARNSDELIRQLRALSLPLVSTDLRGAPLISLHPMLAADLAAGTPAEVAAGIGLRAAQHFESTGAFTEAFDLLFAQPDKSGAIEFLSRRAPELGLHGEGTLVRSFLDKFSPQDLIQTPELQLQRAILAALEGEPGTVMMWLEMFEGGAMQLLAADERLADRYHLLREAMAGSNSGPGMSAPLRGDDLWGVGAHIINAFRAAYRGDFPAAESAFQAVEPFSKPHPLAEIWRASGLGWVYWETGRRTIGLPLLAETAQLWREYHFTTNPTTCHFECLLALYALDTGDTKVARTHFDAARTKLASLHTGLPAERLCATVMLCEIARALGDNLAAELLYRDAEQLLGQCVDSSALTAAFRRLESGAGDRAGSSSVHLSKAELKILRYLPSHYTVPQIAKSLYLSPATVRTQVQAIYRKLGAHHRSEAVDIARSSGLID